VVKRNEHINLIQVLRGFASLLVVLYHLTANTQQILQKEFCFNFFSFGWSGVDIFFVLSGFIITYTSRKGIGQRDRLISFLRRRAIRIFPTFWIITGLFLLFQVILPSFYKTHYSFDLANLLSTFFLLPGHTMVNGVSWTLSYEIFFYFLFSFAFIIPKKEISFFLS